MLERPESLTELAERPAERPRGESKWAGEASPPATACATATGSFPALQSQKLSEIQLSFIEHNANMDASRIRSLKTKNSPFHKRDINVEVRSFRCRFHVGLWSFLCRFRSVSRRFPSAIYYPNLSPKTT